MLTFVDCKLLRVITSGVSRLIATVISNKKIKREKQKLTHTLMQRRKEANQRTKGGGEEKEIDSNCRRPLTYTACSAMDAYKFGSFSRNQSLTLPAKCDVMCAFGLLPLFPPFLFLFLRHSIKTLWRSTSLIKHHVFSCWNFDFFSFSLLCSLIFSSVPRFGSTMY